MHAAVALSLAGTIACAGCGTGAHPGSPPPAPAAPGTTKELAVPPIDRYRDHLTRIGEDRDADVIDDVALRLGDVHFFHVEADLRGQTRAAATSRGVIGGTRSPDDAWYELLGAGDAAAIADRIAWLESRTGGAPHRRERRTVVAGGAAPAAPRIDPALWRAAQAPRLDTLSGGARRLTAWLYTSDADEPVELVITAPPAGPSAIEAHPAHTRVAVGDVAARATEALRSGDDDARRWALLAVVRDHLAAAAPAVAALLASPDASLRADAAVALAGLRSADTVDALAAACGRETDAVAQQMMLSALGNIGTPGAIAALSALRPQLSRVAARLDVVHALARAAETSPAPARAALAAIAADDADAGVRRLAADYSRPASP
jgi:hypothetical protein